jgi:hypothetical protein
MAFDTGLVRASNVIVSHDVPSLFVGFHAVACWALDVGLEQGGSARSAQHWCECGAGAVEQPGPHTTQTA